MKWFVLLYIPALAAADTMHWVRRDTNHHGEARVEVSFVSDTKMVVTDRGSYKQHDDLTTWANTWTGTFNIDADNMNAALTLKDRTCSKTSSNAPGKTKPCDPIDKAIKIRCIFYETSLETPGKPHDFEMLWNCSTDNKLGETPLPWVFGYKAPCIEATSGRSGTTYKRC